MKQVFAASIIGIALSFPAAASTLNFNSFATGAEVNSLDFGGGVSALVLTTDKNDNAGQAVIFDTNNFTGNDDDLVSPFPRTSNPSEGVDLEKVLIIEGPVNSNLPSGSAGPTPDDSAAGGTITLAFNQDVTFRAVDYVDTESSNNLLNIVFKDAAENQIAASGGLAAGDGQFDTFSQQIANVRFIHFNFGGSGALDNLSVTAVPVPASLPILASGLALFGFLRRRRNKS